MGKFCIILGKSGSGKSTSIKGLNSKETVVINVLNKALPFKGSNTLYNKENKNIFKEDNYVEVIKLLQKINEGEKIKNIVIDDAIYIMTKEFFKRAKEPGFTKFTELAQHFQQILQICEEARDKLKVFLILHSEEIISDKVIVGYKARTVGNLVDNCYNPLEVTPMLLYSEVSFDDKGKAQYGFYTHTFSRGGIIIPAKTPDSMFEDDFIPNDLGLVVKAIDEYYK